MIERIIESEFRYLRENFPAVGLVGARQVGKTTLARALLALKGDFLYLDLERNSDRIKLSDPELFLKAQEHRSVILDEIQFMPELFPLLRALIDDHRRPGRFVILGSASPALLRQSSESMAGRIAYLHLHPLNLLEASPKITWQELWLRGGFPEPALKLSEQFSQRWQQNFIDNYLQRDLPALGLPTNPSLSYRLLQMLASQNGAALNFSQLARSMGVSTTTAKHYFHFFENAFLVYQLKPWYANLKKRLVKTARLFFADTGMLHHLLGISKFETLLGHIAAGSSWENFAINQIRSLMKPDDEPFYYRSQDGAEIDLLVRRNADWLFGLEIKLSNAPKLSKGTYQAMKDLKLQKLYVITPEAEPFLLQKNVEVCNLAGFLKTIENDDF